jgi:hypothetical protein
MSRAQEDALIALLGVVAVVAGFWLAAFDIPIFFGLIIADARDPSRPGGMKAVTVSPLELLFHVAVFVGSLYVIWRLIRRRRMNSEPRPSKP